ncbi:MAG TPA: hypothetical protein VFP22_00565 [Candidatus Limnocylindrales bacterium]|nr:hypothetical protein [Candidatus Limnocylindrales bacterium]
MAKGDWIEVLFGQPGQTFKVTAIGAGQKVEKEWDNKKGVLRVSLLTRNGNAMVEHEFTASAVLRVSSKVKAE